jgi:1-acyl-sn-glycerol-3-phosphate acyltransferase
MKRSFYIIVYFLVFWILLPGLLYLASMLLDQSVFHKAGLPLNTIIPGCIIMVSGFLLLLLTVYQFRSISGEFPVSATPPAKIIQRGFFAVWRHPIYLFASIVLFGASLVLRSKAMLFVVFPSFMVLVVLYIIREESVLIIRFGQQYLWYRKNVPVLVPRVRHWLMIPAFFLLKIKFRVKVINREYIPSSLPFIVISGHRHYLDPLFISYAVAIPLRQISTYEMFRNPVYRLIFRWLGAIPRRRFIRDSHGTRKIISTLRSGQPICMFPEGGRSWTGRLRPFKLEAIRLLQQLDEIPVVPVRIEGNYHSWPRWANKMTGSRVTVTIEKTMHIDKNADPVNLEEYLRNIVEPDSEFEDSRLYLSRNRIENISKVIYRCPVCLYPETPDEISPDSLYCNNCKELIYLRQDLKLEFRQQDNTVITSIFDVYNYLIFKYSDIYNISPESLIHRYGKYINQNERIIIISPCQLWYEVKSVFRKSIKGLCLLSDKTITILNENEKKVLPLKEISAATIESNFKLQIYNEKEEVLHQITFDDESALKYQDLLEIMIKELYNRQIITR